MKTALTLIVAWCAACLVSAAQEPLPKAKKQVIKVIAVVQDPIVDGKRLHEVCKTPGYNFTWNDPWQLNKEYEEALEEICGGVIDYQVLQVIDSKDYFTFFRKSGKMMTEQDVVRCMMEPGWATLKEQQTGFDYAAFVAHHGFDKMVNEGQVDEIWVWTFPYGGMWESNMLGKGAFWLNSNPTKESACVRKLSVMGLNYERDLACAIESYGHRTESVMMQVFGWWAYDKKNSLDRKASASEFTDWELYCAYEKYYGKFEPKHAQIGNIHFPPNGRKDYDWKCADSVYTYADSWKTYPNMELKNPRLVTCSEWGCNHLGYMKWWFSHLPRFEGINPKNGKLNNWWHYVVQYDQAVALEKKGKK